MAPPPARKSFTFDFKITTVTYGGGVDAGMPDRITPFRGSEVRGALRFWWRASRGSKYPTLAEMRKAEGEIWGDTDRVSPIEIEILNGRLGTEAPSVREEGGRPVYEEPRYALFPAQNKDTKTRSFRPIFKGGLFQLKFRCPSNYVDDLDAALRYFTNYGGMSARTRRGVGALYCPQLSGLNHYYTPADLPEKAILREWPQLKGAWLALGDPKRPMTHQQAWETAINLLRDYRQDRNGRMGRSKWPEPDEIRRLTGQSAPAHATPVTTERGFSRGKLGAPIIFHFRLDGHRAGDPEDTELRPVVNGEVMERMASPVILKPFAVSETQSLPLCLVLNAPQPDGFDLSGHPVDPGKRNVLLELVSRAHQQWGGPYVAL